MTKIASPCAPVKSVPRSLVKVSGPPALAVETSSNAKLGLVSATYASQASCPRS
jgi:hypothetical protein